jgi:hypothetical protein
MILPKISEQVKEKQQRNKASDDKFENQEIIGISQSQFDLTSLLNDLPIFF